MPDDVAHWQTLDTRQREQLLDNFTHYFHLSAQAKTRVVAALPEPKRIATTRTLNELEQLSETERGVCLAALKKLGQMSAAEQAQFYANAEIGRAHV